MGRLLDIAHAVPPANTALQENKQNLREKRNKSEDDPFRAFRAQLNTDLSRLHDNLIKLRIDDPPRGSRAQALAYQARQIDKMAVQSVEIGGTEDGWPDDSDVFADRDQITALRQAMAEVESGPYPVLLPEGCVLLPQANFDPFEHGRFYDGRLDTFSRIKEN